MAKKIQCSAGQYGLQCPCELGKMMSDQLQKEESNICDFFIGCLCRFHRSEYIQFLNLNTSSMYHCHIGWVVIFLFVDYLLDIKLKIIRKFSWWIWNMEDMIFRKILHFKILCIFKINFLKLHRFMHVPWDSNLADFSFSKSVLRRRSFWDFLFGWIWK